MRTMDISSRHPTISFYPSFYWIFLFFFTFRSFILLWRCHRRTTARQFSCSFKLFSSAFFSIIWQRHKVCSVDFNQVFSCCSFDHHVVCTPDVCNKHGTCIPNVSNSFTCQCDPGFIGPTCNQGSFAKKDLWTS